MLPPASPRRTDHRPAPSLEQIHLALVDDDPDFRGLLLTSLQYCTDIQLVACAAGHAGSLALLAGAPADVLLVATVQSGGAGAEVIRNAGRQWPGCGVMALTALGDRADLLDCIEAGAIGYLSRDGAPHQMLEEIRCISRGGASINPLLAHRILTRARRGGPVLSTYEVQALELMARGFTADEAARRMQVSRHTVLAFVRSVYARLQAVAGAMS